MSASITSGTYHQPVVGSAIRRFMTQLYDGMVSIQERRAAQICADVLGHDRFEAIRSGRSDLES